MKRFVAKVDVDVAPTSAAWAVAGNPTPRRIHSRQLPLDSLEALRREAARVYRSARGGLMPTQEMTRFIYALGEISKLLTCLLYTSPSPRD